MSLTHDENCGMRRVLSGMTDDSGPDDRFLNPESDPRRGSWAFTLHMRKYWQAKNAQAREASRNSSGARRKRNKAANK